ncbi:MAG: dTDP-4-dehydrorhamnose 3,5-epimerase family protein [Patescibacteria group bacterium]
MIDGVVIKQLKKMSDLSDTPEQKTKLGFLLEVLRQDDQLLKKFGQTVFTVAYAGTIKAFHCHQKQDDLWFVASGQAKIVLYDRRPNSKTFKEIQVIMAGADDYKLILIPAGVAHGYQVLDQEPVLLFYHTSEMYNKDKPDEERIPFDDSTINFDWNKK